ncbi:MAG: AAA family ATPase [Myxococcota bacterium]|nr:AAA family ATPase [Myxococcota bacterium]
MARLKSLEIRGFKSIDGEGQSLDLGPITVLLGANGAGKSNLVSFLRMLNYMTSGGLQQYVATQGFADSLLYFGAKTTSELSARLQFEDDNATNEYAFRLQRDATNRLFFLDETVTYQLNRLPAPQLRKLGGGSKESQLIEQAQTGDKTCAVALALLSGCRVFQFHDTSATAKIRSEGYVDDARYLRSDGGNLAAFLRALSKRPDGHKYYDRIIRRVRQMTPQFGDFELSGMTDNERYVRLNWHERDSDHLFGPHQLSDGALRFMALTALFLQPPELRPKVIIVDEPELGLHPSAIASLAGMVKAAAVSSQVILATQSPRLVDEFAAEQVVIVERDAVKPRTVFRRLDPALLSEWLERYCLSELWEKNVLGGQP